MTDAVASTDVIPKEAVKGTEIIFGSLMGEPEALFSLCIILISVCVYQFFKNRQQKFELITNSNLGKINDLEEKLTALIELANREIEFIDAKCDEAFVEFRKTCNARFKSLNTAETNIVNLEKQLLVMNGDIKNIQTSVRQELKQVNRNVDQLLKDVHQMNEKVSTLIGESNGKNKS